VIAIFTVYESVRLDALIKPFSRSAFSNSQSRFTPFGGIAQR